MFFLALTYQCQRLGQLYFVFAEPSTDPFASEHLESGSLGSFAHMPEPVSNAARG